MNREEKSAYNRAYRTANKARIEAKRAERKAAPQRCCSVQGCDEAHDAAGYCARHYAAYRRNGHPVLLQQQHHGMSVAERLAVYTKRSPRCWEWIGAKNAQGYGVLRVGESARLAHRIAYVAAYGPIAQWMCVLHRCDNPSCVRPDHLFVGTLADNNADMDAKGRRRSGPRRGSANHNAKLTEADAFTIRASKAAGVELARKYGVSQTIISAVRLGRTWKHVK